ncbi:hypothetical protein ACHAWU_009496 [Discostella pseudostelligera]|uniref:Uncharacterized protein n=1 Tax=Discostella pseudostelligera TaxID=259834 RepID=A0ABD3M105_9STRA
MTMTTNDDNISTTNNADVDDNVGNTIHEEGEYYQHGKPYEGMCCLCTMEDITEEDGNYVEYQTYPSLQWKPCQFEASVVQQLLDTQFQQYLTRVKSTDCQAELKRLLKNGPPIYIHDKHGLPLAGDNNEKGGDGGDNNEKGGDDGGGAGGGDTHVCKLWFASDGKERSAKLTNSLEGEERERLWQELKKFIIEVGKEVGDDDEEEEMIMSAQQEGNGSIGD